MIEYQGEAPGLKYTTRSFNQLKSFYQHIRKQKGCIIRGGIYTRQVYKLRHDFKLTFKPIPIAVLAYGTRAVTPSANIAPDGFMTFQTIHGAGTRIPKGRANSIGMIRSVGLMIDYFFKRPEIRGLIDQAMRKVLAQGYRTMDIYRKENLKHKLVGTKAMADCIIKAMGK